MAELERQLNEAKNSHDFEKAISLRDKITKLKASSGGGGGGGRALDAAKYDGAITLLDHKMKELYTSENFEACIPLRDTTKNLKNLKRDYDGASGPARMAVLDKLEAALANANF